MGAELDIYRLLSPLVTGLSPLARPFSGKLRAGLDGRDGLTERLLARADQLHGCLWIHASSVGEYLQGVPLIAATRAEFGASSPPIAFTHFSPSGYDFARRQPHADFHDYLPLDSPAVMSRLVRAWRPRALVFVKGDVWPNLVVAAGYAKVPTFLMAGSLPPHSARLRWPGRPLYRDLFDQFTHLGVSTDEDRRRFAHKLGVTAPITVTGDTRIEQVIVRYEESEGGQVSRCLAAGGGRLLVLGSTWPADERLWLPVLADLRRQAPDLRVVLCPHEPRPERLHDLESQLAGRSLTSVRLSALLAGPQPEAAVVLVDSVGVLAEIYRAGHLAYVGGAFTTGVHNTMEPAVAGLPVLFGPGIQNAEEAGLLVRRQAGWVCEKPSEALSRASSLLNDRRTLDAAGAAARQVVLDQRGATQRSMAILRQYLGR